MRWSTSWLSDLDLSSKIPAVEIIEELMQPCRLGLLVQDPLTQLLGDVAMLAYCHTEIKDLYIDLMGIYIEIYIMSHP